MNRLLADAIVVIHFGWIFYVLIGQLLILVGAVLKWGWVRNFYFRFSHLAMMMLVAVEALFGIDCPLTIWEKQCRGLTPFDGLRYGESDSFIARWLGEIIFIDTAPAGDWRFTAAYIAFAALAIACLWFCPPRRPVSKTTFAALVHLFIGVVLLASYSGAFDPGLNRAVGALFLVQSAVVYLVQFPRAS